MEWAGLSREGVERRQVELIVEYLRGELSMAEFAAFKRRLDAQYELHHVDLHVDPQFVRPNPHWRDRPDPVPKPSARARAVLDAALAREQRKTG